MSKLPIEKNPSIGTVAYSKSKMMFIARATTGNEGSTESTRGCASFTEKNRWAFMIVDYESTSEIRANAKDDEEILKKLQSEYAPKLEKAITNAGVKRRENIKDFSVEDGTETIYLKTSLCAVSSSMKSLLKAFDMRSQVKTLKDEQKESGALHTRMLLPLDVKECNAYVAQERNKKLKKMQPRQRSRVKNKKHHAYAVLAWAYAYKEDKEGNLTLIKAKEAQVGLVPRARFECGLFFDGTNNNMFNIQMREDYERYLKKKKRIIELKQFEKNSLEDFLTRKDIPKSTVLPLIHKDLSENIKAYTQAEKESAYESSWFDAFQNKASQDSEAIYDYFHNESSTEVEEFVEENLLPSGADSSYTGGRTNVVRLHELYTTDVKSTSDDEHLYEYYRDKIYVTGAGTYDHRNRGEHEEDEVFRGAALAMFSTGVVAKVEQACKTLATKLATLPTGFVDTLSMDVFGFSRGAAEARHFVGAIADELDVSKQRECVDKEGKPYTEFVLSKNGKNLYPYLIREKEDRKDDIVIDKIIFRFVGIFDTVPHYGLFQSDDAKELNLKLEESKVSRVVHLTAKDEFRYNFDLFSIKSSESQSLKESFIEKEFFGAHSDIGGGYRDDKPELVTLARERRSGISESYDAQIQRLVLKWNKKNHWVKNPEYKMIKSKNDIDKIDGFYVQRFIYRNRKNKMLDHTVYKIYMYRKRLENEYAQLPLEYMFKHAYKIVPLKKELGKLKYKDMAPFSSAPGDKFLWATESMSEEDFNPYKSQFVHHSASLGIAHKPNDGTENGLYGKRTIHYV